MKDIEIVPVKRPGRFTDALDAYFTGVILPRYMGKSINRALIEEIRVEVIEKLRTIVHKASFRTHDDLITWLGHEYFCAVEINGMKLGQLTGAVEAPLEAVPVSDLRRYAEIYRDTDIGDKLTAALSRRS